MEYFLAASVIGTGYVFNNNGKNRTNEPSYIANVSNNEKPNGSNIYNNTSTIQIRKDEQEMADRLFEKTKNSENSNVMIAGPPAPIFNKIDYTDKNLPIEFNNDAIPQHQPHNINKVHNISGITSGEPVSGGFQGISLTGEQIKEGSFVHNNMTPFFGSCIKQNVDENANRGKLENFTGSIDNYQNKQEISPMFKPTTNVSNPYGTQSLDGFMNDRYVVGNKRANVAPIEKVYVGPGLNQGYSSAPTGGFQQSETRDYAMPKTTNETRVKTNPKVSYYGRINPGEKISKPGKVGEVSKNNPDTYFEETPDMYFTTTGAVIASKQRPDIVMKNVNRPKTQMKKRVGPAAPTAGSNEKVRSKVQKSHRKQLQGPGFGGGNVEGGWNGDSHSYGKDGVKLRRTNRPRTTCNKRGGNLQSTQSEGGVVRNNQKPRRTRKTNVIGNSRQSGNIQAPQNRSTVYDPNDIARTTIKETNIHDNRTGNLEMQGPARGTVYDPNDIAKTTIKETNIHDNRTGNVATYKETFTYNPADIAKITTKETTIASDLMGNINKQKQGGAYKNKEMEAVNTNRQFTTTNYTGNSEAQNGDGYKVADVNAPNTNRQFTTDKEYSGIAGAGADTKPQSYTDIYNSTIKSIREDVAVGRTPAARGVNQSVSGADISVSTRKVGDLQNKHINERGVMSNKVYNSLPQKSICGQTKDRESVPNKPLADRLDPNMLNAFKTNPYTQPLDSFFYN